MGVGQIDVTYAALSGIINFTSNQLTAATVGVGDGTSTTWCSSSIYCANHGSGALGYNAALQTGATITGYITTSGGVSTLNVSTLTQGALAPGLILSGSGLTGAPTLSACTSDCVYTGLSGGGNGAGTTWTLSSNQGAVGSSGSPVLFTLAPSDGAIWPNSVLQQHYSYPFVTGGINFGAQVIKSGTFQVTVNGTVVCSDAGTTFSYALQASQCTGAGIASSFINYVTGAYSITFTTAPANGAVIQANFTNIASTNATGGSENIDPSARHERQRRVVVGLR
jgi:hypothetical protein